MLVGIGLSWDRTDSMFGSACEDRGLLVQDELVTLGDHDARLEAFAGRLVADVQGVAVEVHLNASIHHFFL